MDLRLRKGSLRLVVHRYSRRLTPPAFPAPLTAAVLDLSTAALDPWHVHVPALLGAEPDPPSALPPIDDPDY